MFILKQAVFYFVFIKYLKKIMEKVLSKLNFNPEYSALVIKAPEQIKETLKQKGFETDDKRDTVYDFVMLFATSHRELDTHIAATMKKLKYDNYFWINYPKGSSGLHVDMNRDTLWKAMEKTTYRPVTLIAFDDDWSAMRFRPVEKVKTKSK